VGSEQTKRNGYEDLRGTHFVVDALYVELATGHSRPDLVPPRMAYSPAISIGICHGGRRIRLFQGDYLSARKGVERSAL
jgi:hypothetical protein